MRSYEQDRRREDHKTAESRAYAAAQAAYQANIVVEIMRSVALGPLREPWKAERSGVGRQRLMRFAAACHRIATRAANGDEEKARYLFGELRAELPWLAEAKAWRLQGIILQSVTEAEDQYQIQRQQRADAFVAEEIRLERQSEEELYARAPQAGVQRHVH